MLALESVPAWTITPFVLMLLAIAIMPLIPATAKHWEDWRFQLGIALLLGIPVAIYMVANFGGAALGHTVFEYIQFIALLWALFAVSGGLFLAGDIRATPRNNSIVLAIGAVLASFIGTTGAAMLLIRPLLNINHQRKRVAHTVIFTILIVANNGGLLTPLGDPPLFLGFLRGVPFTWTFHLVPEWAFINLMLLSTYYALDIRAYAQESAPAKMSDVAEVEPIRIKGGINFLFFAMIIAAVAVVPSLDLHAIEAGTATWASYVPWRELVFIAAVIGSMKLGSKKIRYEINQFTWGPIREVAVLFIGIFLTMMPALRYLAQVAPKLPLNEITFYGFTGLLSSFLDNAPTYATFFEMAAQLPGEPTVAGVPEVYLTAISLGAVTCGAMTYIGNGPNFMVKSVAEAHGIQMPSFGGYIGWTLRYLLPILVAMVLIFIADSTAANIVGYVLTVALLARDFWIWRSSKDAAAKLRNYVGSGIEGGDSAKLEN